MNYFVCIKKNIKYLLTFSVFTIVLLWCFSSAANDLLWQAIDPAYQDNNIITMWENVDQVWKSIIIWSNASVTIEGHWGFVGKKASIIVKVTKILLSLVIALAVTMILYNGMMYIIQTWQWKEAKDLTKNIAYIVVWILVALFSVVIITLIQSIPNTLEDELISDQDSTQDNDVVEESVGKRIW